MKLNISTYFRNIAAKKLSYVEVDLMASNQHEFNGVLGLRDLFGPKKIEMDGVFIRLDDNPDNIIREDAPLTWYDAREKHPTRTEYRLYYGTNEPMSLSSANDLVVIGRTKDEETLVLIAPEDSTSEKQLLWLFNVVSLSNRFQTKDLLVNDLELSYSKLIILNALEIETVKQKEDLLPEMIHLFKGKFPSTAKFSAYARSKAKEINPVTNPDLALITWLETEEQLFKTMENYFVSTKLDEGFKDVEEFISYSLSVQNRRKSRAGHAFEHHLAAILDTNDLPFSKGQKTERNNKPDFLFPGIDQYNDPGFESGKLTMLGVKTTVKDRWRQVLSEADRIPLKHLITLEPAISLNQTNEMISQNIQLVIPVPLMDSFSEQQLKNIISLKEFIGSLNN